MSEAAQIFQVARIEAQVAPYDWPFERERAGDIAAHWRQAIARKPAMFDGRVLLAHRLDHSPENGGLLRSAYFETAFSAFLAYRDFGFPGEVYNGFAMAALRSADGAFLLGEMGAHTASAGMSYFPAGTPDPGDVIDDCVDLAGSVVRELREDDESNVEEGSITDDGAIDHAQQKRHAIGESRAIARAGQVGLTASGVIAHRGPGAFKACARA